MKQFRWTSSIGKVRNKVRDNGYPAIWHPVAANARQPVAAFKRVAIIRAAAADTLRLPQSTAKGILCGMNISIAVTIPEEVKRKLAVAIERLQPVANETLWTERDQLQLPIATIGEISPSFLPHVTAAATAICAHTSAFPINVTGYGFFGSKRFPHRVWAAIDPPTVLDTIYEEIWAAMRGFGFEKPGELIQPHIVLGICKAGIKNQALVESMDADEECEFGAWDVKKVTLYDCKTSPRGKVHRKVNQIPLCG